MKTSWLNMSVRSATENGTPLSCAIPFGAFSPAGSKTHASAATADQPDLVPAARDRREVCLSGFSRQIRPHQQPGRLPQQDQATGDGMRIGNVTPWVHRAPHYRRGLLAALLISAGTLAQAAGAAGTAVFERLHTFSGRHGGGIYMQGGLLAATDGWVYGATTTGGFDDGGTIFRVKPDHTFETVTGFQLLQGRAPVGDLVEDPVGNIYGVTNASGKYSAFTVATDGSGFTEARVPAALGSGVNTLSAAPDGSLYATASGRKPPNGGVVVRITP